MKSHVFQHFSVDSSPTGPKFRGDHSAGGALVQEREDPGRSVTRTAQGLPLSRLTYMRFGSNRRRWRPSGKNRDVTRLNYSQKGGLMGI
jgi:hypothetical protein